MCKFCESIFDGYLLWGLEERHKRQEESDKERKRMYQFNKDNPDFQENHLEFNSKESTVDIIAETGDQPGSIDNVNYCPYCGEKIEKRVK